MYNVVESEISMVHILPHQLLAAMITAARHVNDILNTSYQYRQ